MTYVVISTIPCILWAFYNTGLQTNIGLAELGDTSHVGWRIFVIKMLGISLNPESILANMFHGMLYFIPIYLVTLVAGGICEVVFATVRGHEVNEGFLVTGFLIPLVLPPAIPLWMLTY